MLQADQPHLDPWEDDGANNSGNHSKQVKDKKVIEHGFIKEKLGLTNLIDFCSGRTGMVDEGEVVIYLNLSKPFGTVSHNIFIDMVDV